MTDNEKLAEARKRVKRKKDFYEHLATYLVISVFLIVLNFVTAPGNWWFHWPVMGWGMAVLFNYLDVFGVPGVGPMNKEWEHKAINEELQKMDQELGGSSSKDSKPSNKGLELKQLDKERRTNWDDQELV